MAEVNIDPATTALVLIDLEHGIVGRKLAPYTGEQVVANARRLVGKFREKGLMFVFVHVELKEILSLPADSPRQTGGEMPPNASELVPGSGYVEGDIVVTKRQWGAFYGTQLDQLLRRKGVKTIVIGGVATNFGVESTARAGFDRGYEMVFVEDAMSSVSTEAHEFSTKTIFPVMGRVRSTEEILEAIG